MAFEKNARALEKQKGMMPFCFTLVAMVAILFCYKTCYFISKWPVDKNKNYSEIKSLLIGTISY